MKPSSSAGRRSRLLRAGPAFDGPADFDAAVAEAQGAGLDPDRDYDKVYSIYRMKRLEG